MNLNRVAPLCSSFCLGQQSVFDFCSLLNHHRSVELGIRVNPVDLGKVKPWAMPSLCVKIRGREVMGQALGILSYRLHGLTLT